MKKENKNFLNFDYYLSHKNWGLIDNDEPFELFYDGQIKKLFEPTFPKSIGMFELVVYELDKAKQQNQLEPMFEMMNDLSSELNSRFSNMSELMNDFNLDFKNKERIIYLKNVIIHPDYRGKNVLEELIKSVYITQYTKNSLFFLNTTPIQFIKDDVQYYNELLYDNYDVTISEYFKLKDLPNEYDEMIDYKIYSRIQKLNFTKFKNTNYFYLKEEKDILDLFKKTNLNKIFKKSN